MIRTKDTKTYTFRLIIKFLIMMKMMMMMITIMMTIWEDIYHFKDGMSMILKHFFRKSRDQKRKIKIRKADQI